MDDSKSVDLWIILVFFNHDVCNSLPSLVGASEAERTVDQDNMASNQFLPLPFQFVKFRIVFVNAVPLHQRMDMPEIDA
jgi:hypothetical protein